MWLIDTGCGHDLIGKADVDSKYHLISKDKNGGMEFHTANGATPATKKAKIGVDELGTKVNAWILSETPAVLSVGQRCMEQGYTFVWPSGKNPFLITPGKKNIVELEVINNIPYLVSGAKLCQPRMSKKKATFPAAPTTTGGSSSSRAGLPPVMGADELDALMQPGEAGDGEAVHAAGEAEAAADEEGDAVAEPGPADPDGADAGGR